MLNTTREGESVLVYIDDKRKFTVKLERGRVLGTDKGFISHDVLIGLPYGSPVKTSTGVQAYLLKPLRQDYLYGILRSTQIIYPKDAALMIYLSGIGCGSKVGEAGVGSGALSIAIASIICDEGRLYGYDISERALEVARGNLEMAGLLHRVILSKRDIREGIDVDSLDAFFLDIPDPWNAIKTVSISLKPSSPLLAYVPTVNQVEKTVLALRESGVFRDIHVYEVLLREYSVEKDAVRPKTRMIGHTGYIIFARRVLQVSS
ncbi:MAG: tRNA (adenine-N1)-methyltransferase [Desulfurococcaceae archaeon]|nr:tRNA (adenine-N1)-methyltransferase [Desulfurococcaceae archaeon]